MTAPPGGPPGDQNGPDPRTEAASESSPATDVNALTVHDPATLGMSWEDFGEMSMALFRVYALTQFDTRSLHLLQFAGLHDGAWPAYMEELDIRQGRPV